MATGNNKLKFEIEPDPEEFKWIEGLTKLLDSKFKIPGTSSYLVYTNRQHSLVFVEFCLSWHVRGLQTKNNNMYVHILLIQSFSMIGRNADLNFVMCAFPRMSDTISGMSGRTQRFKPNDGRIVPDILKNQRPIYMY